MARMINKELRVGTMEAGKPLNRKPRTGQQRTSSLPLILLVCT